MSSKQDIRPSDAPLLHKYRHPAFDAGKSAAASAWSSLTLRRNQVDEQKNGSEW
jgi:hypothetical protein